jgi:ArsR family transcriptional regulator
MSYKISVLFVCTGNSARSQMAEALLRHEDNQNFEAVSAGTHPKAINPKALAALEKAGVSTDGLHSKPLDRLADQLFDVVITLCDKAAEECPPLPDTVEVLAWHFEDPSISNDPLAFERSLQAIHKRIKLFALVKTKRSEITPPISPEFSLTEFILGQFISPVQFSKCLADETRARIALLISGETELCVCELTCALDEIQPKISRHLAQLRTFGILEDRRQGQWVYYRLHPNLPAWALKTLTIMRTANGDWLAPNVSRLDNMEDRPLRCC